MTRSEFHRLFKSPGPAVTPVIHVRDVSQAVANAAVAARCGAAGVFLINHDFGMDAFLPLLPEIRAACPDLWIGVNCLAQTGAVAFPALADLAAAGCPIDAYWADDARIDERAAAQPEAEAIAAARAACGWPPLYFGGVAFKKQRPVPPAAHAAAARLGAAHIDVVTTSGAATGVEADAAKIASFRVGLGDRPLALASGVTPENAAAYCADVDAFLVATGINVPGDFHMIDPARLAALLDVTRAHGAAA